MATNHFKLALLGLFFIISGSGLAADDAQLHHAQNLLDSGRLTDAEMVYKKILIEAPKSIEAHIGLATVYAWNGDYSQAEIRYRYVLKQQPDHLQALVGLGYAQGWSRQLKQAQDTFALAAKLVPGNFDVEKGSAFVSLWRGDAAAAVSGFEKLVASHPNDVELRIALGQAYLLDTNGREAIDSFNAVLTREPDNRAALDGYRAAYSIPSKLEIDLLYGNNEEDTGIRLVEVGSWVKRNTRIWFRYDDSLSLDVPDLTSGDAETLLVGVFHEINEGWLGKLEIGQRDLPDDKDQDIYSLEIVRLLRVGNYKVGLQSAPHSDDFTDKLFYGSFGLPIDENWFVEPTLYLSQTGALEDESQLLLTRLTYQSDALWSVQLGLGFGDTQSDVSEFDGSTTTTSFNWYMPISPSYRISLLLSNEDAPASDNTSIILGLTWRLQKGTR